MDALNETTAVIVHSSTRDPVEDFDRAHVWFCDLDTVHQTNSPMRSLLSERESARAERLKNPQQRERFAARCAFVRRALANLTGVAPETLEFRNGPNGKPALAPPSDAEDSPIEALEFNLAHSENILALAVAFSRDVGVDVEVVDFNVDVLGVAEANFAPEELNWLHALPSRECVLAFYRLWTRKEAIAKATGQGIVETPVEKLAESPLMQIHSFQFKLGEKEIIGALALGAEAVVDDEPCATFS